ncbi:hypothetical protein HIM_02817 [Hirsutella minnesotensis 3608]|nr:hypothetical protein HIM_02817 [Hirsutella minnesotensis 3608]
MDKSPSSRPMRPQTIKDLVAQAESFTFNTNIPFKHWTRAAETLHQEVRFSSSSPKSSELTSAQAMFAVQDGDYGRAYMMMYRHSVLVLKSLPTHPQFHDPDSRAAFRPLSKRIDSVLDELERIKPAVEEQYADWEKATAASRVSPSRKDFPSSYADFAARDPTLRGTAKVLDASEHQDLAVDLAQKELARRDKARRESRVFGASARQMYGLPESSDQAQYVSRSQGAAEIDLQKQMEAARRALSSNDHTSSYEARSSDHGSAHKVIPAHYNYPSIAKSRPVKYDESEPQRQPPPVPKPSRPPKERLSSPEILARIGPEVGHPHSSSPKPPVPGKVQLEEQTLDSKPLSELPPLPKKERLAFKPGAYLENGDPIRSVFLPSNLRSKFLEVAAKNTRAGLEMCGILCGSPVNNALFVRCLLIPDQRCTSDTCETENEGAMFDYCASEDLLVLGWIHTHPTQTCFMSSRDLHTQAGYQVMMPESIAIVCAPKFKPDYGVFRLTHPPGLDYILDCKQSDTFHMHAIDNIYRDSEHPHGHVYESDKLPLFVHDLRTK